MGRRAGCRTHFTTRNLVPCCLTMTATPRIFGFDPLSQGTVLPAFGHEHSPSSVQGGPAMRDPDLKAFSAEAGGIENPSQGESGKKR
jgi:hypothetical protein